MWNPTDVFPFSPSIEGIANTWLYVNNEDSIGTITSAGFLATGGEMGMQVGDLVWVINQITPSSVVCQVTAITHGGTQNFPVSATITAQPGPPGGAVNSVHNTDGSLVVTPTTGTVVARLSNTGVVAGPYTNANITIDAQGRVLVAANGSLAAGAPLTKTDDTNVTLTLGGLPSTAVVTPASLTLGWTGTLSVPRGGIGAATLAARSILFGNGTSAVLPGTTSTVTSVATVGTPFAVPTTAVKVLLNKSAGAASYVTMPLASTMLSDFTLIKDVKGDADTNNITIQFTSGQLCDGTALVVIGTKYGSVTINPLPGGTGWYSS